MIDKRIGVITHDCLASVALALVYRCATKEPRPYGTGKVPYRGCIGYSLSYKAYIILPQIDAVQCHTQTRLQLKKRAPPARRSSILMFVSAEEHNIAEQYSNTGRTKRPKASLYMMLEAMIICIRCWR